MSSSPILIPKQNIGESDEIRIKKYLFTNQSNIAFLLLIFGIIASGGIKLTYSSIEQIKKSGTRSKADLEILFNETGQIFKSYSKICKSFPDWSIKRNFTIH